MKGEKMIFRYIKGTINCGFFFIHFSHLKVVGYTNSNWSDDLDERKSTTGFTFFMGDIIFLWNSKKQPIATLSSCEAEYVAATSCVCHRICIRNLMKELNMTKRSHEDFR